MKFLKLIKHLFFFTLLTLLTQVGGIIWLISLYISKSTRKKKRFIFPIIYLIFNLIIIPPVAKSFGREQLPLFGKELKPRNWCYPLLFRNYVTPKLKKELKHSAHVLYVSNNTSITYLDANFPFIDGFPLLPHLSHNDGKKLISHSCILTRMEKPPIKNHQCQGMVFMLLIKTTLLLIA